MMSIWAGLFAPRGTPRVIVRLAEPSTGHLMNRLVARDTGPNSALDTSQAERSPRHRPFWALRNRALGAFLAASSVPKSSGHDAARNHLAPVGRPVDCPREVSAGLPPVFSTSS